MFLVTIDAKVNEKGVGTIRYAYLNRIASNLVQPWSCVECKT